MAFLTETERDGWLHTITRTMQVCDTSSICLTGLQGIRKGALGLDPFADQHNDSEDPFFKNKNQPAQQPLPPAGGEGDDKY